NSPHCYYQSFATRRCSDLGSPESLEVMLELSAPSPGLLFFSFLYRSDLFDSSVFSNKLEALYGPCFSFVPGTNPLVPFYAKEMRSEEHTSELQSREKLVCG